MADITICTNKQCPSRGYCYRFNATPNSYGQSYAEYAPNEAGKCDGYIQMRSPSGAPSLKVKKVKKVGKI